MPPMSKVQSMFCRSGLWRAVAGGTVLPWSLQGFEPSGDVLEIGAGSGAMAVELLARHQATVLTVTDFDEAMVDLAGARLASFGDRATVRQADATALPFGDASFDAVFSSLMLHHTIRWEAALAESIRVLRPGGHLAGYDLVSSAPLRLLHRRDGHLVRMMTIPEIRDVASGLPVEQAIFTPSLAGLVVRFSLRKIPR